MVCVTSMVLLAGLGFAQDPAAITGWTVQENLVYDYVDSGEGAEYVIHPTQMAGGVIVGNRIYMVGGYNTRRENGGWDDTNYAYSFPINPYDGTVGDCRIEADLPEDEATTLENDACYSYIHEAVVATDTHIYIHGGSWNTGGSNTSDRNVCTYTAIDSSDTTLESWSVTAEYPSSYAGELAVAAICENGYLYCFGGHDKNNCIYAQIQGDGSLGTWTEAANLPRVANFAACESIGNYIILLPGIETAWDRASVTKKVYVCKVNPDGTMDSWVEQTAEIPEAAYNCNLEAVGNTLFMVGARNTNTGTNSTTWVWRATFNSSAADAAMVTGWTDSVDTQLPYPVRYHEVEYSPVSKTLYIFCQRTDRDPVDGAVIDTGVVNEVWYSSPLFDRPTPTPTPVILEAKSWGLYE